MSDAQTHTIPIRRLRGSWYIDDPANRMKEQQLMFGVDTALEKAAAELPGLGDDFLLQVSESPQNWARGVLEKVEADAGGFWYDMKPYGCRGWLSGFGLGRYFSSPPDTIYFRLERDGGRGP